MGPLLPHSRPLPDRQPDAPGRGVFGWIGPLVPLSTFTIDRHSLDRRLGRRVINPAGGIAQLARHAGAAPPIHRQASVGAPNIVAGSHLSVSHQSSSAMAIPSAAAAIERSSNLLGISGKVRLFAAAFCSRPQWLSLLLKKVPHARGGMGDF
jgi:hypothetical protein